MLDLTRRALVRRALLTAAAGMLAPSPLLAAPPATRVKADPFKLLGLASGDPGANSVVLWARLALDLADTARWGLDADAYRVQWEVRPLDQPRARPIRSGTVTAARDRGYAVHVEVGGLRPARPYAYTFRIGDHVARGITRTAPAPNGTAERLRFVTCSCAEYENELFFVYDQIAKEEPDLVIHLGDYIYEETYDRFYRPGTPDNRARRLRFDRDKPCKSLADYRRRYAEHKTDPMLQRAHAVAPWVVTWDDHEVANDYAGDNPEHADEQGFVARRIAAYRAYFENMPIRLSTLPVRDGRRQLYRRLGFGNLMTLHMLDERAYRDPQACRFDKLPGGKNVGLAECPALEADRTMLGAAQEQWFVDGLTRSTARWNIIAQGVMFSHLETRRDPRLKGAPGHFMWNDTWSGYLPARARMLELLAANTAKGPVLFSGDIHAHFVNRVFRDWRRPGVDPVATEFVTAAVSSFVRDLTPITGDEANKDVIAFYDKASHGYVSCVLTAKSLEATSVRITAKDRSAGTSTADRRVKFRIDAGNPELHKL